MERPPVPEPADRPMGILAEPNPERALLAAVHGRVYARHPVRTHLVTDADDAVAVVSGYVTPLPAVPPRLAPLTERPLVGRLSRAEPVRF